MSDLNVGDTIRDNDPRMYSGNRTLRIVAFEADGASRTMAICEDPHSKRQYRVRVDRIKTDGKKRRSGFNRVPS